MSCNPFNPKAAEWDKDFQRLNIVAKDSHSIPKYQAQNPTKKHFNLFKVDGRLINNSTEPKCDFLLIEFQRHQREEQDCKALHSYYIELKGSDLKAANEQVHKSIKELHTLLKGSVPHARIVLNRINTIEINSNAERLLKRYIKKMNGTHSQQVFNNNKTPEIL